MTRIATAQGRLNLFASAKKKKKKKNTGRSVREEVNSDN